MISITNYSKSYGGPPILAVDSLQLEQGIIWFKGKNGSGKSTMFKSIAGLISFEGSITCNKVDIREQPVSYRKLVNYAETDPQFPAFLTLNDLVQYVAKAKNASNTEAQNLLERLSMKQFEFQQVGTFSSGMLKKAGLILAFLGRPQWIVLDEPFSTIDHDSTAVLAGLIEETHEKGINFIISSHIEEDQHLPFTDIVQLDKGTIL